MDQKDRQIDEIKVDLNGLCKIEKYTDQKNVSITALVPVTAMGKKDTTRETKFMGSTSFSTPFGVIPINVDLKAKTITAALNAYPKAIKSKIDALIAEADAKIEEMEKEQAEKNLIIPAGNPVPNLSIVK